MENDLLKEFNDNLLYLKKIILTHYPFDENEIVEFSNTIDWTILLKNKNIQWTTDLIKSYLGTYDWREILASNRKKIPEIRELILELGEDLDWIYTYGLNYKIIKSTDELIKKQEEIWERIKLKLNQEIFEKIMKMEIDFPPQRKSLIGKRFESFKDLKRFEGRKAILYHRSCTIVVKINLINDKNNLIECIYEVIYLNPSPKDYQINGEKNKLAANSSSITVQKQVFKENYCLAFRHGHFTDRLFFIKKYVNMALKGDNINWRNSFSEEYRY